jgi:hypothetical protein
MPDEHDRSGIEVDRADRQVIEQAAAQLRHGAIRAGYAGLEHKHIAFALALVLDELPATFATYGPRSARRRCAGADAARRVAARPRRDLSTGGGTGTEYRSTVWPPRTLTRRLSSTIAVSGATLHSRS